MLHACVKRFDVMGGRGNILGWEGEVNKAYMGVIGTPCMAHRMQFWSDWLADLLLGAGWLCAA
jgi:hypothetical protein